jgi:drug/metabolite transporter (DMT)-like permease
MKKQYLILAIGVVAVSLAVIFIRLAEAPPLVIAAWRMSLAALIIIPLAMFHSREEFSRLSGTDIGLSLTAGLFLALHFGLWTASLSYTTVATSVILVTANPIFVSIASYLLFKERITRKILTGIIVSFAGTVVIGYSNWSLGPSPLTGAGLALLGAFTIAVYLLIGRRLRRHIGLLTYSSLTFGSAALFLLGTVFISGQSLSGYPSSTYLMFILLALVPQLIGHTSLNQALKYLPATMITIAILGEPVISSALAYLILGEPPAVIEIIGGILILGGIFLAFRNTGSSLR